MLAFKVSLNGKFVGVVGAEDLGVLGVSVEALGILGNESRGVQYQRASGKTSGYSLKLNAGGLTHRESGDDEHLEWISGKLLSLGDEIEIEVIETSTSDEPVERKPK